MPAGIRAPAPATYSATTSAISNALCSPVLNTDTSTVVSPSNRAVWSVSANVPITDLQSMEGVLESSMDDARLIALLFSIFAGVALVLGLVGVYGIMAYTVVQRTHEFGIRKALGARAGIVIREVLLRSSIVIGAGVVLGVAGAVASGRLLERFLFGVSATDAGVLVSVGTMLALSGLIAAYLPARRASAVDPLVSLRTN